MVWCNEMVWLCYAMVWCGMVQWHAIVACYLPAPLIHSPSPSSHHHHHHHHHQHHTTHYHHTIITASSPPPSHHHHHHHTTHHHTSLTITPSHTHHTIRLAPKLQSTNQTSPKHFYLFPAELFFFCFSTPSLKHHIWFFTMIIVSCHSVCVSVAFMDHCNTSHLFFRFANKRICAG